jgi:UDP-glucose 4-epimerase
MYLSIPSKRYLQEKEQDKLSEIKNCKVLITGGAGFIGSNLADELITSNEIVVVDDLSMGKVENLPKSENLHFFEHSITDYQFMNELLVEWNFDYIFLLAAVASVADTVERPMETHEINQNANLSILETIRVKNLPIKKLYFASSAAVYGNDPELPKKETSMVQPLSPYAVDKYATERFVLDYCALYGIPTVVTRFFNVYGPKQNPKSPYSGVLSIMLDCLKNDKKFTMFGDGTQIRDFVYVKDVVKSLLLLVTSEKATGRVFNVATGRGTSLNFVRETLEILTNRKLIIEYSNFRIGDIRESRANVDQLASLGMASFTDLKMGLQSYIRSSC